MKTSYLKFYENYQPIKASLTLLSEFTAEKSRPKKQSILNRLKDYWGAKKHISIHKKLSEILLNQTLNYKPHD